MIANSPAPTFQSDNSTEPVASWHRSASLAYARKAHRLPLDAQIQVRGLDEQLNPVGGDLTVRARDISSDGISFRHEGPMPYRFVEVILDTAKGPKPHRVRLTWCRYSVEGCYVSGGRFLLRNNP